jgi:hypothetical protein
MKEHFIQMLNKARHLIPNRSDKAIINHIIRHYPKQEEMTLLAANSDTVEKAMKILDRMDSMAAEAAREKESKCGEEVSRSTQLGIQGRRPTTYHQQARGGGAVRVNALQAGPSADREEVGQPAGRPKGQTRPYNSYRCRGKGGRGSFYRKYPYNNRGYYNANQPGYNERARSGQQETERNNNETTGEGNSGGAGSRGQDDSAEQRDPAGNPTAQAANNQEN